MILIFNKSKNQFDDRTDSIASLHKKNGHVFVTYHGNHKQYQYFEDNVRILEKKRNLSMEGRVITLDDVPLTQIEEIEEYEGYLRFRFKKGITRVYERNRVKTQKSCLETSEVRSVLNYIQEMSKFVSNNDHGQTFLYDQFQKIEFVSENSVLSAYLQGASIEKKNQNTVPIFPFGFNLSQKKAVETALVSAISVIEGPPGTGKTQTILNIIANVISQGNTIAVVSGNNSATDNVIEKLEKYGYGFNAALLGNQEKRSCFFEKRKEVAPDLSDWALEKGVRTEIIASLKLCANRLTSLLRDRNSLADYQEKLLKLKTEERHFLKAFRGDIVKLTSVSLRTKWSSSSILELIYDLKSFEPQQGAKKWYKRIQLLIRFGMYDFSEFENGQGQGKLLSSLNRLYYEMAIMECQNQIILLQDKLKTAGYDDLMKKYRKLSELYYRDVLYQKHGSQKYNSYTPMNYKNRFADFITDYPIVLSTTHAIRSSIKEHYLFDYLIIDEASQVDIVTASLAMSCCRNLVIVGDLKQLPQIVTEVIKQASKKLQNQFSLPDGYDYAAHSILSSMSTIYTDGLPITLLSEHYRCHPKIIRFCNEKFYDNRLIIMTEGHSKDDVLKLYKTVPGQHARRTKDGWMNMRQIEVIRDEVLVQISNDASDYTDYGVIAPYREQVKMFSKIVDLPGLEVDTVHKYQGREKKTIIFTTVSNDINTFLDNPNLINVAISRAINHLVVVTSEKLFKMHGTNLGDLMRYMEYNGDSDTVVSSKKNSVFDLLYSDYSNLLVQKMSSAPKVSKYQSEILMYLMVKELLKKEEFNSFKCVMHVPLYLIVRDFSTLDERAKKFASNPWTHVDFLIFNKMDKEPILIIEVDGYAFHANNADQLMRDQLKDEILASIQLPIIRFATNCSGEKEALSKKLEQIVNDSYSLDE